MKESILTRYFRKLEKEQGMGTCRIQLLPVEGKETGDEPRIEQIGAKVCLMAPFHFKGKEHVALGEFEQTMHNAEGWIVKHIDDIDPVMQQARMKAYLGALVMLDADVRKQMKETRPSVSLKKQAKKSDGLLRRIGAEGLI